MDRAEIPAGESLRVSGYFDPLTAGHARRLEALRPKNGACLVVVIAEPVRPVLPARARAELVAALGCVDYVVIAGEADVHLESEHAALYEELVRHAARRQQA